jgi:hypothetical protein
MRTSLLQLFSYIFWPNPGNATYGSPKSLALLLFCALLIVAAFGISVWRRKLANPVTKKLTRTWAATSFWFGFTGLLLIVARVEQIQFLAMRFLWIVWIALAILYIVFQMRSFRMRHYEVLPKIVSVDPRSKYLPKRKR